MAAMDCALEASVCCPLAGHRFDGRWGDGSTADYRPATGLNGPSVARSPRGYESDRGIFSLGRPARRGAHELAGAMSEVEVEAGVKVITLDDYGTAIYFIEQGEADVLTDAGEAIQALGPGDTFGEIALLLTGQRTATVVARTPMRLLSLSGQDFERIRPRVPELERSLRRLGLDRAVDRRTTAWT